jgi:thiol peroxidase
MTERKGLITVGGIDMTVVGEDLKPGDRAPSFTAQAQDWSLVDVLESTKGKGRVIAALPSLSTSVCDRETRKFNEEAVRLSGDIAVIAISMDSPFTQKNWCAAAGIERVMVVSDHLEAEFGRKYGCLVKEGRLLRRAVFVIDREGIIHYAAYMPALGTEPDYNAVLEAARNAL